MFPLWAENVVSPQEAVVALSQHRWGTPLPWGPDVKPLRDSPSFFLQLMSL